MRQIRTGKGRIWTIGPVQKSTYTATWDLLDCPSGKPHKIFFEDSWRRIHQMAFESNKPLDHTIQPPIEAPQSIYPPTRITEEFFYSSASLTDVASVTLCRHMMDDELSVIGLVFRYSDGRERTVGQVRLDCLDEPLNVEPTSGIALKASMDRRKIVEVKLCDGEKDRWIWMPWSGRISWWFSNTGTRISREEI